MGRYCFQCICLSMGGGCPWDHYQSCITPHHTGTLLAIPLFLVPIKAHLDMFKFFNLDLTVQRSLLDMYILFQLLPKCTGIPQACSLPQSQPSPTDIPNFVQLSPNCTGTPPHKTWLNLFIMKRVWLGSRQLASYWNWCFLVCYLKNLVMLWLLPPTNKVVGR